MRGEKGRDIDYSYQELCEDLNVSPENFKNTKRFKRLLEIYELEINDFKKSNEEKGDYSFSIEWYPLLKSLLKFIEDNPFYRQNYNEEKINSEQLANYLSKYISEIEDYDEYMKGLIESLPIYLDTLRIIDYLPLIVDKLSEFIIAIIKANNGEIGSTLKYVYQELDKAIYYLYKNNYFLNMVNSEESFDKEVQVINKTNKPIDSILASLLKILMESTRSQDNGEDKFDEIPKELLLLMGIEKKYVDENQVKNEEEIKKDLLFKRMMYKQLLEGSYVDKYEIEHCRELIEHYKGRKITNIKDKILNNQLLPHENNMTLEEKLKYLQKEKLNLEEEIKKIKELIEKGEVEEIDYENEIKKEYLKYIDELKDESSILKKATNNYIGQAIVPYLKSGKNIK